MTRVAKCALLPVQIQNRRGIGKGQVNVQKKNIIFYQDQNHQVKYIYIHRNRVC